MLPCRVLLTEKVDKQIQRLPFYIQDKVQSWVGSVQEHGIYLVRQKPGLHDEPLHGSRQGQRSVRLNRAYRLIYMQSRWAEIEIIEIIEVNKHEY